MRISDWSSDVCSSDLILLSVSYFKGRGIDSPLSRDWYRPGYRLMTNPDWTATNGEPGQIVRYDAGYNSTPGGVIAAGPLKGMQFLPDGPRSEEHTSELQSLMRISYAVFCLKKKT